VQLGDGECSGRLRERTTGASFRTAVDPAADAIFRPKRLTSLTRERVAEALPAPAAAGITALSGGTAATACGARETEVKTDANARTVGDPVTGCRDGRCEERHRHDFHPPPEPARQVATPTTTTTPGGRWPGSRP